MKHLHFLALIFLSISALGQEITISGYVKDSKTQEPLIGASVKLDGTDKGAATNIDGYFEITDVQPTTYNITASYIGYKSQTKFNVVVRSAGNPAYTFLLDENDEQLQEVVVQANPFEKLPETPMSIQTLGAEEIATYPGGNNDIAKVVQSLPGVSGSVGGFRNDIIIRGGAPNENVYYLDGIEVPIINHFSTQGSAGGPVGLLNVSFIEDVTLATSAFHARYDNPLSGVLQFNQRVGDRREGRGNLRVSASEVALTGEGPLFKGDNKESKTSFIGSVRRSYLQFLFQVIGLPILPDYWDYQIKVNHKIDDYNELNFISIGSLDDFSVNAPDDFSAEQQATLEQVPVIRQWSSTAGISWKRRLKNGQGFMNTALSMNTLNNEFNRFDDNENEEGLYFQNNSRESEIKLRYEYTRFLGEWTVSSGASLQQAFYQNNTIDLVNNFEFDADVDFLRYGLFVQSSRTFGNRLDFSFGIRSDGFTESEQNNVMLETLSPRLSLSYALDERKRWRANITSGIYYKLPPFTILGFRENNQYVNRDAEYIRSTHLVAGVERLLGRSARITLEGFYKWYGNYPVSVIDEVSLANKGGGFEVLGNEPIESDGKGRAYGLEFLFQQQYTNNFYGILAYTLFWSEFTGTDGVYRPSLWDSRHLLTFTGGYKFGNNWEIAVRNRFIGQTPFAPVNIPLTLSNYPAVILDFDRLGEDRLDIFNQLDIRIDKKWNFRKVSLNLFLEIQNALNQDIPEPPSFGLNRTEEGVLIDPPQLILIDEESSSLLPIIGIVLDF